MSPAAVRASSLVAEALPQPQRLLPRSGTRAKGTGHKGSRNQRRTGAVSAIRRAERQSHGFGSGADRRRRSSVDGAQCVNSRMTGSFALGVGPPDRTQAIGSRAASVHHRRLEDADHRGVRRLPAQVADAMRHIAAIAQRLAGAGASPSSRRRRPRARRPKPTGTRPSRADGRPIRERRPDRPENRTIAASQRSSATRSRQDGIVRRRRRRSAWFPGPDAR